MISDTLFGVMVFLPERDAYTSFSGGDGRFVGIHEDFNSFQSFSIIAIITVFKFADFPENTAENPKEQRKKRVEKNPADKKDRWR